MRYIHETQNLEDANNVFGKIKPEQKGSKK